MRVLIAHNRYREAGGEERHVSLLVSGLRARQLDAELFERDSAQLDSSLFARATTAATLTYRPASVDFRATLRAFQPDVVHFHNIWPLLTPGALRAAKQAGARVVLTAHNCRFACPAGTCSTAAHPARHGLLANHCLAGSSLRCALARNPRGNLVENLAYGSALELQRRLRLLARWTDAVIAPSEYVAAMARLAGLDGQRVHVVPNGVDAHDAVSPIRGSTVLYLGRLSALKGVRTLLAAAAAEPDLPFALAGGGELEALVGSSPVRYLGVLDRDGIAAALADSALTVVPSECHENFPYAALESLAAGRPVVASRVGGLPEIVRPGETGLLVPPGDPAALGKAVRTLWEDRERAARLGATGRRVVLERFTLQRQLDETIELYERLIRAPAGGRAARSAA